jgi:hypothetical protein
LGLTLIQRQINYQKSKKCIVDYIAGNERVSKQDVVDFMDPKCGKAPKEYRTSRVPTLKLISELESAGRIKILNKRNWRSGQSQYLVINDTNQFDLITEQIELNEIMFTKEHPEVSQRGLDCLLLNLGRVHKYIKNENDRFILNEKIINLMLKIRYKEDGLLSKVSPPSI